VGRSRMLTESILRGRALNQPFPHPNRESEPFTGSGSDHLMIHQFLIWLTPIQPTPFSPLDFEASGREANFTQN